MFRRSYAVLTLTAMLLLLLTGTVLAADGTKEVGLVIAFADGNRVAQVVTVPVEATTFEVLQKSGITLVSQSGQFGPAICSINKVGCDAVNCFCDAKHFWAFYHLDAASNKWTQAQEGVGAAKPANGAVEGLIWSALDDKFNPTDQPPVMTFAQIKGQAGATSASTVPAKPATLPTTGSPYLRGGLILAALALAGGAGLSLLARSDSGPRIR